MPARRAPLLMRRPPSPQGVAFSASRAACASSKRRCPYQRWRVSSGSSSAALFWRGRGGSDDSFFSRLPPPRAASQAAGGRAAVHASGSRRGPVFEQAQRREDCCVFTVRLARGTQAEPISFSAAACKVRAANRAALCCGRCGSRGSAGTRGGASTSSSEEVMGRRRAGFRAAASQSPASSANRQPAPSASRRRAPSLILLDGAARVTPRLSSSSGGAAAARTPTDLHEKRTRHFDTHRPCQEAGRQEPGKKTVTSS